MKNLITIFTCLFLFSFGLMAQKGTVTGNVADADGPLIGVSVSVAGTPYGTVTNLDGDYTLKLDPGTYTLKASFIGYEASTAEITISDNGSATANFTLSEGLSLDEIVVLGTRASNRTKTQTAVPVDIINVAKMAKAAPQTSVNEILTFSVPSFSSNTQTISDGTDHIDPASLRGLGPDQVLVLMNGKRRHNTSLVNVNGTFGRGNVGTDMNAIPASAISNIQVLRDGAAAQYGSDAIAGVIDVQLNRSVNELTFNVTTGANMTASDNIGAFEGEQKSMDGEKFVIGANYGLPLGKDGGFINLTGEFDYRGATNRMLLFTGGIFNKLNSVERLAVADGVDISQLTEAQANQYAQQAGFTSADLALADIQTVLGEDNTDAELAARGMERTDFNMRVGQSEGRGGKFFANMALPLGENLEAYAFGGASYRNGISGCFYRLPSQNRTTTSIYLNGTVPKINSNIIDKSLAGGIRGTIGNWNIDLSNTSGSNDFQYALTDAHNATLGAASPTEFNNGGHTFRQNTTNFDISQYFETKNITGINLAFGAEFRYENYLLNPGTEVSYGNYDINGNLVTPTTPNELLTRDFLGRARPSGCQCFAGFLPSNEVDARRSSVAGYGDVEFDISEKLLLSAAIRAENYSDFGSTFNWKLAGRYAVTPNINLRAAAATGFRAPSLHQIYFSRTSTIFENINGVSVAQEVGVFQNNSRPAALLGIPQLEEETSTSFSAGITAKIPESNISITLDGYMVDIDDRIVLTGQFSPGDDPELQNLFNQAGATKAAFFANAINTRSQGLDVVVAHSASIGSGKTLRSDLALTLSQTRADRDNEDNVIINASDLLRRKGLVGTYFDETSRIYLEEAVPRTKVTLNNTLDLGAFNVYLRNTYFGETTEATNNEAPPTYNGKIITDLSLGYDINKDLNITIGANNLLDVYPDEVPEDYSSSGRFIYSRRSPQFSFGGRFVFARLNFTLK